MQRFICIHGHFYQPPRENAWLERVELQDSAYPYHDWNERITAECYAPNADVPDPRRPRSGSRGIVNNYSRISFNFGPTLLSWLERERRRRPTARSSRRTGSAASASPATAPRWRRSSATRSCRCATRGTRRPRSCWGIRDFERRFGRAARGHVAARDRGRHWRRLEVLARHGIRFTRPGAVPGRGGAPPRRAATGPKSPAAAVDPKMPYLAGCPPAGRSTSSSTTARSPGRSPSSDCSPRGEQFAERLLGALRRRPRSGPAGPHRHRRRDLRPPPPLRRHGAGLRAAPHRDATGWRASPTTGSTSRSHPPTHEVRIRENTSWSCAHGLRPLAGGLRLRDRAPPGLEPALARPAAPRAGLAARRRWRPGSRSAPAGCCAIRGPPATTTSTWSLDRAPANARRVPRPPRARGGRRGRARRGPAAARAAAPRDADVHQLRLVLRRDVRDRDRADPAVRLPRARAGRGARSASRSTDRSSSCWSRRRATCAEHRRRSQAVRDAGPAVAGGHGQVRRQPRGGAAVRGRLDGPARRRASSVALRRAADLRGRQVPPGAGPHLGRRSRDHARAAGPRPSAACCSASTTSAAASGRYARRRRRSEAMVDGRVATRSPGPTSRRRCASSTGTSLGPAYSLQTLFRDEQRQHPRPDPRIDAAGRRVGLPAALRAARPADAVPEGSRHARCPVRCATPPSWC